MGAQGMNCPKHNVAMVLGYGQYVCEPCEREAMLATGCRCDGTLVCPECIEAGIDTRTREGPRCREGCSTLCPVCIPDD